MKKITLSFFASMAIIGTGLSQSNYTIVAPANTNANSVFKALNGTAAQASQRSVVFIHEYELLPMNLSDIGEVGFQYKNGTGGLSPVVGSFTLWLQNTTDYDLLKPSNFSAITATLPPPVYVGTYAVPNAAGAATVPITLSAPFNYTGGGLYVVWEFSAPGPYSTNQATLACNGKWTDKHFCNESSGAPVNTFSVGLFRPSLIFKAANTATNEVELLDIVAPGKVAKQFNIPQIITTSVVNSSDASVSNVSVGLNVTGANPYTASQVIPSLASGASTMLTWNAYNPQALGMSTITAAILLNDQMITNNTKSWTQSVTCSDIAQHYANATFGNGYGFNTTGIFAARHKVPASASLTSISAVIGSDASNTGKTLYGVVADAATGAILATSTNTPNITASGTVVLNFSPYAVTGGTDYLFGIAQPASGYYPAAYRSYTLFWAPPYYTLPLAGGTPAAFDNMLYFGIEPKFQFNTSAVTAVQSKSLSCRNEPIVLTASGSASVQWGSIPAGLNSTSPTVAVSPSVTTVYTVVSTDNSSGCAGSPAYLTHSIQSTCNWLGLVQNGLGDSDIKLFPNPTVSGRTTISGLAGSTSITVFNVIGQAVLAESTSEESIVIDLSQHPSGNYMVTIKGSDNTTRNVKIINQN